MPLTKTIIERIVSALRDDITITSDRETRVKDMYTKYQLDTVIKKIIRNTLSLGQTSQWLKYVDDQVVIED